MGKIIRLRGTRKEIGRLSNVVHEENPNHINDMECVGHTIKLGNEIYTAYGSFKLIDIFIDPEEPDILGKWIWTIYDDNGNEVGGNIVMMLFSEVGEYMQMTDCKKHVLKIEKKAI